MTELEIMQRAKTYLEMLSRGLDPISGQPLPQGCGLDQQRLGRCFSYVSGVLGQVIDNGGVVGRRERTVEFSLTPEQLARVPVYPEPVRMTDFIDVLHQAAGNPEMKKLSATRISDWLVSGGYLAKETGPDGKTRRVPTQAGLALGLTAQLRQGRDGEYVSVLYNTNAQRFLLANLDAIRLKRKDT